MKYCWIILAWMWVSVVSGQTDTLPSYFLDGEEVVFEFDIRQYDKTFKKTFNNFFEAGSIDIIELIKADAPKEIKGWKVRQINDYVFQLRCDFDKLNKVVPRNVKYLIEGDYWAQPVSELDTTSEYSNGFSHKFDPFASPYRIDENGNTRFRLEGLNRANQVILAGSFNNWNEEEIRMQRSNQGWEITLDLKPGIYEYKFIVDHEWTHDARNPLYVVNQHETLNSILLVGDTIRFNLLDQKNAQKVILSGSFNNWNETALMMRKTESGWTIDLPLPPGKHYYKFIVDGQWIMDPGNKFQEPDGQGHWNSVKIVN